MSIYDKASLVQIPSGVKSGTLYNVVPNTADGDFDFTRGSSATRVNKDGLIETVASGVPRLDYPLLDGVVQDCPALLLEPSRRNEVTYSESFSNWTTSNISITPNNSVSPDGSQNADLITFDATTGNMYQTITVSASTSYTFTCYAKEGSLNSLNLAAYDLSNGAFIYQDDAHSLTSGWIRVSKTFTTPVGCTSIRIFATRNASSTGTIYLWGAQLEEGSYATSYIPTSGQAVTRSADVCNGAQADFNDSEGVLFAEISGLSNTDASPRVYSLSDGTGSNRIICFLLNTEIIVSIQKLGKTPIGFSYDLGNVKNSAKVSVKYKANDFNFFVNGFKLGSSLVGETYSSGTLDRLNFDSGYGIENFYGKSKQVMAFNEALSDTELENLTSWDSFREMATEQLYTIE